LVFICFDSVRVFCVENKKGEEQREAVEADPMTWEAGAI